MRPKMPGNPWKIQEIWQFCVIQTKPRDCVLKCLKILGNTGNLAVLRDPKPRDCVLKCLKTLGKYRKSGSVVRSKAQRLRPKCLKILGKCCVIQSQRLHPKMPENPRPIPEIWQFCVAENATSNACKSLANTGNLAARPAWRNNAKRRDEQQVKARESERKRGRLMERW